MLRSFRLGNHRSFRDEQELLLMPVYSKDREVLSVAAIYGANASGKSNLLDGLGFMQRAVRDSFAVWKPDAGVPRRPFAFSAEDRPSVFVVELVLDQVRYTYGFEVDDWNVREEWLYSYPESRKRVLFERDADGLRFGTKVDDRPKLELLGGLLRPNALFLSLVAQSAVTHVLPVWNWFTENLSFRGGTSAPVRVDAITEFLVANRADRDGIVDLIRVADLGISDLVLLDLKRHDGSARHELFLAHGDAEVVLPLSDESAGTRSWLSLLPTVLTVLRAGGTLVIDEIDESLHPRLTAALVGLFRDSGANPRNAQLLFTTHDASLLSPVLGDEVLTREDVWFVDKRVDGASELYALTDFKPRKEGENLERRYLGGSYGAVPDVQVEALVAAMMRGVDGAA
ncbi:AAA family ATPase [Lentzea sp. NEAU-D13]|uniref:AAA family ATPase n=1 Tax=Lentzea alba TaxID=2714351 RepID=A0A7C9RLX1_9PSEU|nr:ATP-binding protein [Lentzea alba]NGY57504.1 AAA family ATPase [Lentzea alba]